VKSQINRRDFLKFSAVAPLLASSLPVILRAGSKPAQDGSSPNFLIVLFDAFAATDASLLGHARPTTPNLERLASTATVFHRHYSAGNFTSPSTASILTGTHPWTHRAFHLHGSVEKSVVKNNLFKQFEGRGYTRLGFSHNLLATSLLYQFLDDLEIFKWPRELCIEDNQVADRLFPKDYNVAFTGEKLMMPLDTDESGSMFFSLFSGWLREAEKRRIEKALKETYPEGVAGQYGHYYLLETAIDWIIQQTAALVQPYLAYIHLLPPHEPYFPRKDFVNLSMDDWKPMRKPRAHFSQGYDQATLNQYRRNYDDYIMNVDAEFARLFAHLEQTGQLKNTYVIFTSDHGELFERGIHGHSTGALYEPIVRVPLVIWKPGQTERQDINVNTSHVDLLPTLLHMAGIPLPDWCEGQVLPPYGGDASQYNARNIFTLEAKSNPKTLPLSNASISVIKGKYKMMHYFGYESDEKRDIPDYELFNLEEDPEEMKDLIKSEKGMAQELQDAIQMILTEEKQKHK
jgi:arylsulfatase A-like enzyme